MLVGNWKMNPDTLEEAKALASSYARAAAKAPKVAVVIAPPAAYIADLGRGAKKAYRLSAQDVDHRPSGSFTGSVSARQVKAVGAEYAIVGHSERRAAGDTDEIVAQKAVQAIDAGLRVILCVGEKERDDQAQYLRSVREQVLAVLSRVDKKKAPLVTVAYEPVWAIGKSYSVALSPADIHEMSIYIKKVVAEAVGKEAGLRTQVLYGGSVNFENAQAILSDGEIDGLLVGRQSLDKDAFTSMISYAASI